MGAVFSLREKTGEGVFCARDRVWWGAHIALKKMTREGVVCAKTVWGGRCPRLEGKDRGGRVLRQMGGGGVWPRLKKDKGRAVYARDRVWWGAPIASKKTTREGRVLPLETEVGSGLFSKKKERERVIALEIGYGGGLASPRRKRQGKGVFCRQRRRWGLASSPKRRKGSGCLR